MNFEKAKMKQYGYIKQSRSALAEELEGAKSTVLMRLCLQAAYCSTIHPKCGKIEPGELITSRKQLAKQTGLSEDQVKRALRSLVEGKYIAIVSTPRYTKIAVIWDDFVSLRDNNIMLNTQVSAQVSAQVTPTTSNCDAGSCEDKKESAPNQPPKSAPNNYIKLVENNNNTHAENIYPVRDFKAQAHARDTHAHTYTSHTTHPQVEELVKWMSGNTPELLAMVQPFSDADLRQMVEEHTMDELQTILREMWSNGVPWRKLSAAVEFRKYARAHKQFRERFATEQQPAEKLYTYDEMADYVWKNRVSQSRYFQMVEHNGKMMYRKIC